MGGESIRVMVLCYRGCGVSRSGENDAGSFEDGGIGGDGF